MIWGLRGKLKKKGEKEAAIDVSGIIYKVSLSSVTAASLPNEGEEVEIVTHLIVREDAMDLYGFIGEGERKLFEALTTVSGVGPKAAMSILSLGPENQIRAVISEGKSEVLSKCFGIGKKTAERVVVELKDKIKSDFMDRGPSWDDDVYQALVNLGYSKDIAREAVKKVDSSLATTNERLKDALNKLR